MLSNISGHQKRKFITQAAEMLARTDMDRQTHLLPADVEVDGSRFQFAY